MFSRVWSNADFFMLHVNWFRLTTFAGLGNARLTTLPYFSPSVCLDRTKHKQSETQKASHRGFPFDDLLGFILDLDTGVSVEIPGASQTGSAEALPPLSPVSEEAVRAWH